MGLYSCHSRKYPQFQQDEIFGLQDAFRKLDVDDKGYIDEATAIKATQSSERQPYDVVRQALKEVDLDSSRRVELDDYVGVSTKCNLETFLTQIIETQIAYFQTSRIITSAEANIHRSNTASSIAVRTWSCLEAKCKRPHSGSRFICQCHTHNQRG